MSGLDRERLQRAVAHVNKELLDVIGPDGHWVGELSSSALSTATAVTALAVVQRESCTTHHGPQLTSGLEWLARHQSRDLQYESITLDEVKVRVYHDVAILIGRQAQQGAYRGNSIKAQLRTTLVFVQQQGQWRLASLHLSTIGQPPPITQS